MRRLLAIVGSLVLPILVATAEEKLPGGLPWVAFEPPKFPPRLAMTTVNDGFAVVIFTFDAEGWITDRVALEASHPAFSIEVFLALSGSRIDTSRHQPVIRREVVRFEFRRTGAIITKNHREAAKSAFTEYVDHLATPLQTVPERELYPPLQRVVGGPPEYPESAGARDVPTRVTVDFIVDPEGRVRVPAVLEPVEPELVEASLAAVQAWQFSPPALGGLPVQVVARRVFVFGPKERAPSE